MSPPVYKRLDKEKAGAVNAEINRYGYDVFVSAHASGTFNGDVRETAHKRMAQAGPAISGELQRDWHNDMEGFGAIWKEHIPACGGVMQNFENAQSQK